MFLRDTLVYYSNNINACYPVSQFQLTLQFEIQSSTVNDLTYGISLLQIYTTTVQMFVPAIHMFAIAVCKPLLNSPQHVSSPHPLSKTQRLWDSVN